MLTHLALSKATQTLQDVDHHPFDILRGMFVTNSLEEISILLRLGCPLPPLDAYNRRAVGSTCSIRFVIFPI